VVPFARSFPLPSEYIAQSAAEQGLGAATFGLCGCSFTTLVKPYREEGHREQCTELLERTARWGTAGDQA
jgi:hypothetical protein